MRRLGAGLILLPFLLLCVLPSVYSQESPPEVGGKNAAAIVEYLESVFRYENDGTGSLISQVRVQIKTQQGLQAFGQIYFPFRDEMQSVEIDYVRTVKASGEVINVPENSIMEITAPVAQMAPVFSDLKYKVVPVPNLQVGDWVEYKSTVRIHEPFTPGDFWATHYPTRSLPVHSEVAVLDIPAGRKIVLTFDETAEYIKVEENGRVRHTWKTSNPEAVKSSEDPAPLFSMTTIQHWEQVGDWYLKLQAPQKIITPAIRAKAAELTEGLISPAEKLNALYQYVAQSVRYVSLSFGLGGYQPHAASEVLRNSYGDCKDKHTLLSALLAAVDIPSYPVLLHSQRDTDPDVPSPGQFDHLITVVPLEGELHWMDATLQIAPLGYLPRSYRGRQALLVKEGESYLLPMPEDSPIRETRKATLSGSVDERGTLQADVEVSNSGTFGIGWRQVFFANNSEATEFALKLDRPFTFWEVELENQSNSDPLDLSSPMIYSYTLTSKRFLDPLEESSRMSFPSFVLRQFPWGRLPQEEDSEDKEEDDQASLEEPGSSSESEEEKEPEKLDLGGPGEFSEKLRLEIHPNFSLVLPPAAVRETDFARFQTSYSFEAGKLVIERTLTVLLASVPQARREEVRKFAASISRERDRRFSWRYEGDLDVRALADDLSAGDLNTHGRKAMREGDNELARDLLLRATEKDPDNNFAWNNLGLAYMRLGNFQDAERAFRKQIEINPDDEFAYNNLGRIFLRRGEFGKAIEIFQKQLEVKPSDRFTPGNLAEAYRRLQQFPEAEAVYDAAIAIRPSSSFYLARGKIQLEIGNVEDARESFDEALELSRAPGVYNDIAYALAENGTDLELALEYADSAVLRMEVELRVLRSIKKWRNSLGAQRSLSHFLDTLGWVHFKKENLEEARRFLQAAFDIHPDPEIAGHLSWVFFRLGKLDQAERYARIVQRIVMGEELDLPPLDSVAEEISEGKGEREEGSLDRRFSAVMHDPVFRRDVSAAAWEGKWPVGIKDLEGGDTLEVRLICLIDATGKVIESEAVYGDTPWKEVAREHVEGVALQPLSWNSQSTRSFRMLVFEFSSGQKIRVYEDLNYRSKPLR